MKENNVKNVLFAYVKNPEKWFYWYHNPERLKALYDEDHVPDKDPDAVEDVHKFTKKVWRFEPKKIQITKTTNGKTETKIVVIEKNLFGFFDAVLDEVRIKKANAFAEYALYISDNDELTYFREAVAKREIVADIDHNKQRDHAVHTLILLP